MPASRLVSKGRIKPRLAMAGVNSLTLQLLGRWEKPKMLQRYAHLSKEHLTEALEKLRPAKSENLVTDFTQSKKLVVREARKWCRRGDLNPHDG
jgi:hypothetical protein